MVWQVKFKLPADGITAGDGALAFTIRDGGVVEAAGKSIPILVDNYAVDFYPKGGDLIAGMANRLYFQGPSE